MRRSFFLLGAVLALGACADPVADPLAPPPRPSLDLTPAQTPAQAMMATYVALGTSNSMGVASAGIYAEAQRSAWPAQLANRADVSFTLPLIQDPGCGPPLQPPLALDLVLVAGFAALGEDLVAAVMSVCMPLRDGITLPTNQLAISGAKARDALNTTPESQAERNAKSGELYSRVLLPGQTQVTAMLAQHPTFVSVELAANEVLPASTGRISAMTPFNEWTPVYDQILAAVQSTGAKGVLVGVPNDARNFPSVRRAREFFNQWPYLLTLGISVSLNCYFSSNYLFIPGYVLTLLQKAPTTATCADVPGAADYVLTSSDMTAINARMAQMNAYIQAKATDMGFAYFSLSALYDLPKGPFNMYDVLFSNTPFGPNISLDGVHPSAAGQTILANAAVQAINATYGLGIP
jgi:lysophospholipase L1-like esterase